jgi:type VI secretion system protein ImpA
MASPPVLDLEALALPISDDKPAGEDLREDASSNSVYYQLKDARSAARAAERNEDVDNPQGATQVNQDWRTIISLAPSVLAERSKDFEVVAWLIEALVRVHGFAGVRDGYALVKTLAERFWDDLYPVFEDDSYESRIAPLTGLNGQGSDGTLVVPLRKVPITAGNDENFALWHYQQASDLSAGTDEGARKSRIERGAVSLEKMQESARTTPSAFYVDLHDDVVAAKQAFVEAMTTLNDLAGREAPPDSNIRTVLDAVESAVRFLAGPRLAAPADEPAATPAEDAAARPQASGPAAPAGRATAPASRETAFQELRRIAEFFRATEPQSFISYALDEIVRRGQMPLPELIGELIPNTEARSLFLLSAGIKPPENW